MNPALLPPPSPAPACTSRWRDSVYFARLPWAASTSVCVAASPQGQEYTGEPTQRRTVWLSLHRLVELFQSYETPAPGGKRHYLLELDFDLYLAQCPIYSSSSHPTPLRPLLPDVLPCPVPPHSPESTIPIHPRDLDGSSLREVNLWLGIKPTHSAMHYDSHDNLLHVVRGTKTVRLFSPLTGARRLKPHPIDKASSNHSRLSRSAYPPPDFEFTLSAGQWLYIPEGWCVSHTRTRAHHESGGTPWTPPRAPWP